LASAYKREGQIGGNVSVHIDRQTGNVHVYSEKAVVEQVENPRAEIDLASARKTKPDAYIGDAIKFEVTPNDAGRIAAQTAKQVVLQRLRDAEREMVFEEFAGREGDVVSGIVQRVEPKQAIIDLGKAEAILPAAEQVRGEHYRTGQRIKCYLLEVQRSSKGPQVVVSRTHKNLVRRLFEMEVPEIHRGIVEIKAIAREPGQRSKVAVAARQEGVDAIGSCVGLRGLRIQNIVNDLGGERIDVVEWSPDPARLVANALSPAQVVDVVINEAEMTALVAVPDRQLSLAIGKEGQNARLAAKLTGWRIDIKSQGVPVQQAATPEEPAAEETPVFTPEPEPAAPEAVDELVEVKATAPSSPTEAGVGPQIRFAEDLGVQVAGVATATAAARGKKAKERKGTKEEAEAPAKARKAVAAKKGTRRVDIELDEELEDEF
jgi:N utilization substance protein A